MCCYLAHLNEIGFGMIPFEVIASIARTAATKIEPSWDRTAHLSALATECFRVDLVAQSVTLLDLAVSSVEAGDHPLVRPTSLLSIAQAFRNCQRYADALQVCAETNALLSECSEPTASLSEAMLAMLYARLDRQSISRKLAARIVRRSMSLSGFLERFTLGHAFRIFLALNDFARAERMLNKDLPPNAELALICAAFDILCETTFDEDVRRRANWIEITNKSTPVIAAILMLLHSRLKDEKAVLGLWARTANTLNDEISTPEKLETLALACLAFRNVGRHAEAQNLLTRVEQLCNQIQISRLDVSTRVHLARSFAAFEELEIATALSSVSETSAEQGVGEAIVAQLIEDRRGEAAIDFIQVSRDSLRVRLVFRCALELLKQRDPSLDGTVKVLESLACN